MISSIARHESAMSSKDRMMPSSRPVSGPRICNFADNVSLVVYTLRTAVYTKNCFFWETTECVATSYPTITAPEQDDWSERICPPGDAGAKQSMTEHVACESSGRGSAGRAGSLAPCGSARSVAKYASTLPQSTARRTTRGPGDCIRDKRRGASCAFDDIAGKYQCHTSWVCSKGRKEGDNA